MSKAPPRDPWAKLGRYTPARIALGRAGASLPTREVLDFALAHAQARDAVRAVVDRPALANRLEALGLATIEVATPACERAAYLRRPDWGRRLDAPSRQKLTASASQPRPDVALMIGDGLSAMAVEVQAAPLIEAFLPWAGALGLSLAPIVLAVGARVALGDEVGAVLGARVVAVLIGERPGLSAADSLGVYITFAPQPGRTDAERNCISNIRAAGLPPAKAAHNLAWLIDVALKRQCTGVTLKDESETLPLAIPARAPAARHHTDGNAT